MKKLQTICPVCRKAMERTHYACHFAKLGGMAKKTLTDGERERRRQALAAVRAKRWNREA
jgi:hypothetical protein